MGKSHMIHDLKKDLLDKPLAAGQGAERKDAAHHTGRSTIKKRGHDVEVIESVVSLEQNRGPPSEAKDSRASLDGSKQEGNLHNEKS